MLLAPILGILHAFVDATTVTVVFRVGRIHDVSLAAAFAMVVGYDVLAFASQIVFGWLTDRWSSPKVATMSGLVLTLLSVGIHYVSPLGAVLAAGLGNALFHLGAGASVLRLGLNTAAPSGLFVAPGALGLGFGMVYGTDPSLGPMWPLALAIVVSIAVAGFTPIPKAQAQRDSMAASDLPLAWIPWALLFGSVAIRSLVGLSAARGCPKTDLLMVGVPLAAFLGKSLGGLLADRLGWLATSVTALLLSAPLIAFGANAPKVLLVGLLLFQMTMPVTLTALARLMPHRLATAFGVTCLALALGSLPTFFPCFDPICQRSMLFLWILVAAIATYFGLVRLDAWYGLQTKLVSRNQGCKS